MRPVANSSERLSKTRLGAYSLAEFPSNMMTTPVALFLPAFYTQDLGLSLTAVGLILMGARVWDVATDPIIGYFGDRTRTPIGRRKPWILAALPMMMVAVYFLFLPTGETVTNTYLFGWIMLLYLGWTFLNIPYYAWGAELSVDYQERTRITGWRTMIGVSGTVFAILLPNIGQTFFDFGGRSGETLYVIGIGVLCLLPLCLLTPIVAVPEKDNFVPSRIPIFEGLKIMLSNAAFRRLVACYFFTYLAVALTAPLFVLFINHVIEDPTAAPRVVLGYYVANMLGIPLWMWVARKTDKHTSWLTSLLIMGITFPCFMFLGSGDLWLAAGLLFIVGIGGGNLNVVPASMKADVIDLDTLESGEERAGLFFAAWSTATKVVLAVGVGISLPLLDLFGFDPSIKNGPDELFALQAYYSFVPVIFYLLAAYLLLRWPITREKHSEIRAQLATQEGSA